MKKVLLQEKITHEIYAEDYEVQHPLADMSYKDIVQWFAVIKESWPDYDDYIFEKNSKSYGYGAMSEWYDLFGIKNE